MPQKHTIIQLFRKYLDNQCSAEEVEVLFMLLDKEENKALREELINTQLQNNNHGIAVADPLLYQKLDDSLKQVLARIDMPKKQRGIPGVIIMKWAAVAAVLLLLLTGTYYFTANNRSKEVEVVKATPVIDVPAPTSTKATLRLADGTEVNLDNAKYGSLARQGQVQIIKTADGQIAYQGKGNEILYNTLINPRGSKVVAVSLSDGTKVWLNAESTLRYPTAFAGNERKVEISGEAYFEVAHNAQKPFYVTKGGMEIKVLGTHFNVNTYDDGSPASVTLLEGSVKVSNGGKQSMLIPGQQARMNGGIISIVDNVDMDQVLAWKNGKFQFGENTSIETIMNQVARWYNVQVEYKGTVTQHFWGSISRDVNVSQVLHKIESTGGVKFRIQGNKVLVMP
ncbi:FecR family protein [Flavisolibacter ginsengisoli]|uniref:FecR family protein n=1 Tax=Flavisolibacter ginsengisoli DSM 18119 TaxID=1121884 RepID=A0A1M4UE57_9BACT|nr:FecR family protein [Flavisolibacter ginsengisoli]SHE54928.1 FecR family protein [Flavisolibacter ginsengisoli DSM 18119]